MQRFVRIYDILSFACFKELYEVVSFAKYCIIAPQTTTLFFVKYKNLRISDRGWLFLNFH